MKKNRNLHLLFVFSVSLVFAGCANSYNPLDDYKQLERVTVLETPDPDPAMSFPEEIVANGKYMVGLLGCASCHTNGALVGAPDPDQLLAGSDVGIAYSNPLAVRNPGIVYPGNLTPDMETGIGSWSIEQIIGMIQSGLDNHNSRTIPVMPWPSYADITNDDAYAIALYLKSLTPVMHLVPENVSPGQRATAPFVHFGVYQSNDQIR
tara:strand:- start:451 stop:1071 length:621 start_codon:yes stop_codon:yes gene_type:complete